MDVLTGEWLAFLKGKPDVDAAAERLMAEPAAIPVLFGIIREDRGTLKYVCEKIIRKISEKNPQLIYPYFGEAAAMLDSPNNFIKWGGIMLVANLAAADDGGRFDAIYDRYFSLVESEVMVTSANAAGNAWKIVQKHPRYDKDVTRRLLHVRDQVYIHKGEPSPECRNIVIGDVIECFGKYFDISSEKEKMLAFAAGETENPRKSTAKKAREFLKTYSRAGNEERGGTL